MAEGPAIPAPPRTGRGRNSWLLKADFSPQGSDLLLTGPDGSQVLIRDYFNLDTPPDLMTDAGALIPAELAVKLAGPTSPGQFAMLEAGCLKQGGWGKLCLQPSEIDGASCSHEKRHKSYGLC